MESKFLKITLFLLIFVLVNPLFGQEKAKFTQRLEWTDDEDAFKYKVEVRLLGSSAKEEGVASSSSGAAGERGKSEFYQTVDNFIELTLSAGNYEYRVYAYDFLGKEASVSDWVKFSIIRAKTPVVKELKTNVVVSDSSHVTFDVPLDVSSITEDTKVELINSRTKEKIKGHLDITVEAGKVVASKAVFPEVPEGDWYAKVTNPSGLYTETPSIVVEKTVEKAKEVAKSDPKRTYIPSEADKKAEEAAEKERLKEIAEKDAAAEAERIRIAEAKRLAEEKRVAEEKRLAEEKKRLEEEAAAEAERIRLAEAAKKAEEEKALKEALLKEEEERRKEELAYEKFLEEEKRRMEEAAEAERRRIDEELRKMEEEAKLREAEKRRLAALAEKEASETEKRFSDAGIITKEIVELTEELERTHEAIAIAEEKEAPEAVILEERAELLEERIRLAENAARLAEISATYSEQSLKITNDLCNISDEEAEHLSTVEMLKDMKSEADNASDLAQKTFEEVEIERQKLDKKLKADQKSIDRKIKKLLAGNKQVKNINIMLGGDVLYSPYDKQLFSYVDYPVYGEAELLLGWSPIHIKDNLLGFDLDFEVTDFFSNVEAISLHIPMMAAQLGLDYKQKVVEEAFYVDFSVAGGLVAMGKSVSYGDSNVREDETMHFYLYPCVTGTVGMYWIPAKHFVVEAGGKFSHKFITGMPTGTVEGFLLFGIRL